MENKVLLPLLAICFCVFTFTEQKLDTLHPKTITKRADDAWFLEKSAWPPMPYDFGYEVRDLEGNEQYRNEQSDGNRVTGSYGYFGSDGIYRHVDYVADERGFRAQIRTSEPGVSAQNPANVKIITEPLLPQRAPLPGGRVLRPIPNNGDFDANIIGDPILEKGLSLTPGSSRNLINDNNNFNDSGSGISRTTNDSNSSSKNHNLESTNRENSGHNLKPSVTNADLDNNIGLPHSLSMRQRINSINNSGDANLNGNTAGLGLTASRLPSYLNREVNSVRDASIVTRDPTSLTGIDDILGIGGRGIMIPTSHEYRKNLINLPKKKFRDSQESISGHNLGSGNIQTSLQNSERNYRDREQDLIGRERELLARERELAERNRALNPNREGTKGSRRSSINEIPAHEFVKRKDSTQAQSETSSSSSTSSTANSMKEIARPNIITDKNMGETIMLKINNIANEENNSINKQTNSNEIEKMLMNAKTNDAKNIGNIKVYISDGPIKENTNLKEPEISFIGSKANSKESKETNNKQTTNRKPNFDSIDQQINLKFDDENEKPVKYGLKSEPYTKIFNHQYRYSNRDLSQDSNQDSSQDTNGLSAIQLKRSYPKNYQQYRLLRSRIPRDRSSSPSLKLEDKLLKSQSVQSKLRLGGDKLLNSQIVSIKNQAFNFKLIPNNTKYKHALIQSASAQLNSLFPQFNNATFYQPKPISTHTNQTNFLNALIPKLETSFNFQIKNQTQPSNILMNSSYQ